MSAAFLDRPCGFDVLQVRAQFPILERQVNGKPLLYLDNAASAQKPVFVQNAMLEAMQHSFANVHRGLHTLANETTDKFENARERVAQFLNAESANQIIFTSGATAAFNLMANTFGQSLQAGDEIVLSQMEHHSNIVPWHMLREKKGVVLKWVPVNELGELDMEALEAAIGPNTRLVTMTHMSNVLGTVTDAKKIVEIAHAHDVPVLLDGSQSAVHLPKVDVQELDVDFYIITGHKLYGPTGIGALYGKKERLLDLPPWQGGGEMITAVSETSVCYADPPHRFEAGTPPILEAIGFGAALEWMMGLDREEVAAHEDHLRTIVEEGLRQYNDVRILGQAQGKGAVTSFDVAGMHAHDISQLLDRYGVAVRAGTHCAEPLLQRFDSAATCRVSFAAYNTEAEAHAFLESFAKVREFLA